MRRRAAIYVRGAWAELHNAPEDTLESCLAFMHPKPWYSRAYRERLPDGSRKWDGKIRLFERATNRFPAGLTSRVVEHLHDLDRDVFVSGFEDRKQPDLSELTRDWLPGIELWDHQWDATTTLLVHKRGVIKSPTGSGKTEDIFVAASFLWEARSWRSLIVEPTKGLMRQTYERGCEYFSDWITMGMAGDGERIEGNIVVATGQTMQHWRPKRTKKRGMTPADPWLRELVKKFEVLFLDECLDPSTFIDTPSGRVQIGDLEIGDEVRTPTGRVARVKDKWIRRKRAYTYRFAGGHELIASKNHLIVDMDYRTCRVKKIDEVRGAFVNGVAPITELEFSLEEYLYGLFLADGHASMSGSTLTVKWGYRRDVDTMRNIFAEIQAGTGYGFNEFVNKRGDTVFSLTASSARRLDERYWLPRGKKSGIVELKDPLTLSVGAVRGIMDAEAARTKDRIALDLSSRELVEQVADALEHYGVAVQRGWAGERRSRRHTRCRRMVITGDRINTYNALFGWKNPRKRRSRLGRHWCGRHAAAKLLNREYAGVRDLVDIELDDDDRLFIANGLISHNCHKASSDMWYDIAMNSGAQRRYGFSGTPIKDNVIDDMKLIGATGPIIYDVDAGRLIDEGLAAKPKILMVMSDEVSGPSITDAVEQEAEEQKEREARKRRRSKKRRKKTAPEPNKYRIGYRLGIMCNDSHNAAVVRAAQWMIDHDRKTLLLCRYKEHYDILAALLDAVDVDFVGVWGASDNSDRAYAKEALGDGRVKLVLATGIWDEGEDIPGLDGIVLAEGVAATTNSRQRVGRGMRGDTEDVWVVDFVPTCDDTLREHAAKRAEAWEGEGYEVLVWTKWPKSKRATLDLPFKRWDKEVAEVA